MLPSSREMHRQNLFHSLFQNLLQIRKLRNLRDKVRDWPSYRFLTVRIQRLSYWQFEAFGIPYQFVRNIPSQKKDILGLRCRCGEALTAIFAVGPIDAMIADNLADQAMAETRRLFPGLIPHNNFGDAFRHCFWSCRMTQEIGEEQAEEVGDIHERCARNQPPREENMDRHNNAVGRILGADANTDCSAMCMEAVKEQSLQLFPDNTDFDGMNNVGGSYYE